MHKAFLVLLLAAPGIVWTASPIQEAQAPKDQSKPSLAQAAPQEQTAGGELARVDAQRRLFWIKAADGKELQFSYNEQTQVEGAREGVEGLAGMSGRQMTVQYRAAGGTNTAVKITVRPPTG